MPRSATTALYTRVDNSFSNPVVGTTIDPSNADMFFDDVESAVNAFIATSTSSVAIGTGSKTFTVAADIAGKSFLAGTFVHIWSRADTADYMFGSVTSYSTSTGALVVDVTATGGSGTNTDWNIMQAGARGAAGATGSTGATGATSGIKQAYSSTTTDGDPGNGAFRLNNATPASATEAYLDNLDSGGATVSSIIDLWDDSTTTTRGYLRFEKSTDPTVWAQYAVTGSVVDGTGYRKITLSSGAGSGAFTNADTFAITFFRSGDKGSDGAGTGDVVGPASATDNALARFDGTTGKLVQNSAVTVDDTTGKLSGARFGNAGLQIEDTNASHLLTITPGSDLTAGRVLTLTTGDTDRTVTISGNTTISQDYSTSGNPQFATLELGHATDTTLSRSAAGIVAVEGVVMKNTGKETIWIPAIAMTSRTTNGAASGSAEMSTNKNMFKTLNFDATTQEFAQFEIHFPKSWNLGTVTFQPVWSHAATTTNFGIVWGLAGVARSDDDAGDVAFGTAQTSTDTGGTTNDIYIAPESSAITIAGTPAAGDTVQFQINRTVADAGDTMAIDARLHGIRLFFTTNAATDA